MRMHKKPITALLLSLMMAATPVTVLADNSQATHASSEASSHAKETTEATTEAVTTEATTATSTEDSTVADPSTSSRVNVPTTEESSTEDDKDTEKDKKKKKDKEKKEKEKKESKKEQTAKGIVPKVYHDTRIEMKDKKQYVNNFIYFNQGDSAWNQNGYHIKSSGCGPTAMAVCIASLTGKWVTPLDTAMWAYENGYYTSAGALHAMIPALAEQYKLNCDGLGTDADSVRKALKANHPVVALMGPGHFTKKGHFIVLVGIDDQDQVTVADVGSRERTSNKYALKDIIKETKSASNGGPLWEISKPEVKKTVKKAKKKVHSAEFMLVYNDMKSVLQKNYSLIVPMKAGKFGKEDQVVIVSNLDINDKVTMEDSQSTNTKEVSLEEVVENIKKDAIKAAFSETVTIEPNETNLLK